MFGGKGYFRASSVLFSGGAGTAKTSLAAHFLDAACRRGERALCFQFEESPAQYIAQHALDRPRPRSLGEEGAAAASTRRGRRSTASSSTSRRCIAKSTRSKPSVVVVDPLSSFTGGSFDEVNSMVMRLIDFLKGREHHRACSPT